MCADGHPAPTGARFCPECGKAVAGRGPRPSRWASARFRSVVIALGVLVLLIAGTAVNAAARGECAGFWQSAERRECAPIGASDLPSLSPEQLAAQACYADYAWAVQQMVDYQDAGFENVANEWGSADGRVQTAAELSSAYLVERATNGRVSADDVTIDAIKETCNYAAVGLD